MYIHQNLVYVWGVIETPRPILNLYPPRHHTSFVEPSVQVVLIGKRKQTWVSNWPNIQNTTISLQKSGTVEVGKYEADEHDNGVHAISVVYKSVDLELASSNCNFSAAEDLFNVSLVSFWAPNQAFEEW